MSTERERLWHIYSGQMFEAICKAANLTEQQKKEIIPAVWGETKEAIAAGIKLGMMHTENEEYYRGRRDGLSVGAGFKRNHAR